MKTPIAERFGKFVKVGTGVAIAAAVIALFCAKNRVPPRNASADIIPSSRIEISQRAESLESSAPQETSSAPPQAAPININTATAEELQTLPGIGETKAAEIIRYREERGGFSDIREITNVSGIGEKTFEQIRDRLTVGDVSASSAPPEASSAPPQAAPININTATAEELQTLPGIGEVKAAAIIRYREEHGGFSDIHEITSVSGIGEKTFEQIRDRLTVGDVSASSAPETSSAPPQAAPININTATAEELQTLPGIGEVKAAEIIRYREEHGGFSDIREITNVSGIGEKTFEKISGLIVV